LTYTPPKFSAKKVAGKRAYDMARRGEEMVLPQVTSRIERIELLHYRHPFVTFEAEVSEGTYIRSLGTAIAEKLGVPGALSALERLAEGAFVYENEKPLDPVAMIDAPINRYRRDPSDLLLGKRLERSAFETKEAGRYVVLFDRYFAIIEIMKSGDVRYLLNKVERCWY